MKKRPFCSEETQNAAIKCRRSGESTGKVAPPPLPEQFMPWYFRTSSIVIAICNLPPLALPMIWWRPHATLHWKIGMTIVILISTVALCWLLYVTYLILLHVLHMLFTLIYS